MIEERKGRRRTTRVALAALEILMGLAAAGGGVGLILTDGLGMPEAWLEGSPFGSYLVPGLVLMLVGAVNLVGASAVLGRRWSGAPVSALAGLMWIVWFVVQISVVGFVSLQQPAYFLVGVLILVLAAWLWRTGDNASAPALSKPASKRSFERLRAGRMKMSDREPPSRSRQRADDPVAEGADTRWSWLYKIGGAAALFSVALIPVQLVVFGAWGQPETAIGWFTLFQDNELAGLLAFEILFVVNAVIGIATALALYVALRRVDESLMAIATVLVLLEAVAFIVARPALEMLYLSNQFAAATTDAQRAMFLAAGEAVWATFHGTAYHVGINLFSVYYLIVSAVMLRSHIFGKVTAYTGILAAILNWGIYVPGGIGLFLFTLSVVPFLAIWLVLVARRLFQLGRAS